MKSNAMKLSVILMAALFAVPLTSSAEKADRSKEIIIDAAKNIADQAKNVLRLEGNVSLEQGTMRITADKMILKRDEQNNKFAEFFSNPGNQITFREKREGFNDFMEGSADRAEFDERANTIKLFTRAKLKNGSDTLTGEYIYYNSETEVIQADGRAPSKDGKPAATDSTGRVRIVIQPRNEAKDAKTPATKSEKK